MNGITARLEEPVDGKASLVEYLKAGCKPVKDWRIGTEHEKFAYHLGDLRPLEYDGPVGIRTLLEELARFGWDPVVENGNPIALSKPDGSFISLEPAGQVELSGAPVDNIHQTCDEVTGHLEQVKAIARELGIGFIGLGFNPKWPNSEMPWMPKGRYEIMREYMPKKGALGLEMMKSSCTVQVNLDFDSEATMVTMYRISLALQPVATALWANSPFKEGKPNGYLSYRSHVWT
ncbi:MAG: glutamate--cysteine ligase, partial [Rhodospirillales bacterium]